MKFTCERSAILAAAETVGRRAKSKSPIPILSNILITAAKKTVSLLGHDLDHCCTASFPGEIKKDGSAAVDAAPFISLLRGFPEGAHVECEIEDEGLKVRCGRGRYALRVLPAADFPTALSAGSEPQPFSLSRTEVENLFERTAFAVYTDNDRAPLMGLFLHIEAGPRPLAGCATDGKQLFFIREALASADGVLPLESNVKEDEARCGIIVPLGAMNEIVKLCDGGAIELVCSRNIIEARTGSTVFASKLIDAKFPDFRKLIEDAGNALSFTVDRKQLIEAVTRLRSVSPASISLSWEEGAKEITVGLGSHADAAGTGSEPVEAECVGATAAPIHVPAEQLIGLAEAFAGVRLVFETEGLGKPIRFRDPADNSAVALQMPIAN